MTRLNQPKIQFLLFSLLFVFINIFQAAQTTLFNDEAYYWMWSQKLAWGYFDHPPLIALMVAIGGVFSETELGVRLLSVFVYPAMAWILWKTLDQKERAASPFLFLFLFASMAMLQIYGFIATPDTPLVLFTALFFLAYKQFLTDPNWKNSIFLGLIMVLLMYSKYHGVLIIGFVLLSNLKILKDARFWAAVGLALLLYVPHLYWQFEHDYPSFRYHLFERGKDPYKIDFTLNVLLNMLVVAGLTFPVVYYAFFKRKDKDMMSRAYRFVVVGFVLFFILASRSKHPQAQWMVATAIPLVLMTYPVIKQQAKLRKWLYILGGFQFLVLIAARLFLIFPSLSPIALEPHIAQDWIGELKEKTEGKPIVFSNMYAPASLYQFYTGIQTHSRSIVVGRKSQYDLNAYETLVQNKDVYLVGNKNTLPRRPLLVDQERTKLFGEAIDNYESYDRLKIVFEPSNATFESNTVEKISFRIHNPYQKKISFDRAELKGIFLSKKRVVASVPVEFDSGLQLDPGVEIKSEGRLKIPELKTYGQISFRLGFSIYDMPGGFQGNLVELEPLEQ